MSTVSHRVDYAKFNFSATPERAQELYRSFIETVHAQPERVQRAGGWKLNALGPLGVGPRRYNLEVWGLVTQCIYLLPPEPWVGMLTRVDYRAVLWEVTDTDLMAVGTALAQADCSYNVHVFSTKKRQKKGGRDAGGKGFAIGSHKSDLRISFYRHPNEQPAQEYQLSGEMLRRLKLAALRDTSGEYSVRHILASICDQVKVIGAARTARVFEAGGLGTAWPDFGHEDASQHEARTGHGADDDFRDDELRQDISTDPLPF